MKKIFLPFLLLSLSGCLSINSHPAPPTPPPAPIVITTNPPIVAPKSDPLILAPVSWKVYNANDLKNIANGSPNVVLFTLDEANFKNLSDNLNSIDKNLKDKNAIIDFLLKAANAPADSAKETK